MPRKRHKPEEIVAKLRQVDVMVSQGQPVADAVRSIGVTEVTYYRWRQEFGGLRRSRSMGPERSVRRTCSCRSSPTRSN
jgi:transposase-like protein